MIDRPVRLTDVAKAAGVSQGTASNVFSRPELVRAEVRARVEEAAGRLGYRGPDPRGRLLRAGKVNAIGVVVSDDLTYFFNDPFNREFMIGLASACDEQGAGVSLISAAHRANATWSVQTALVDGFIVQCMEDGDRLVELAKKRGLPFVACDIDPGADASSVRIDDRAGARMAAEHLLALGHRRFGVLSLELRADGRVGLVDRARRMAAEYAGTRDRLFGYGDAFAAAGIDIEAVPIVEAFNDAAGAAEGAASLLDAAPTATAMLAMSDVAALALVTEAKRRGLAVPRQLSVIGFDDVPEAAAASPRLTTIRQPIREKGRRAAALILAGGETRHELLPVQLIVRGTTAPPPG